MKVIIDTSSLVALVRYYARFDKGNKMFDFIRSKVEAGEIIIIDAVLKECEYQSKGIVVKTLDYLTDKDFKKSYEVPTKTKNLLPPSQKKFYNLIDNNFKSPRGRILNEAEFEVEKKQFLESADARMIIYALNELHTNSNADVRIVTEETEGSNDNKAFKKIPAICKILNIKSQTLPELLEEINGIDVEIK